MSEDKITRGMRNNNPGNIRHSPDDFQGEISSTDKSFKQFKSMIYGYRALIKILQNYEKKYGCNTIRKIINRWAPDNENNTTAYIGYVSKSSGYGADEVIDLGKKDVAVKIVRAISDVENSGWHDTTEIMKAFDLLEEN
jgi:hypothetical protein